MIASTFPYDPALEVVSKLFPAEQGTEHIDEEQIFYPTNAEEFEQMIGLWEGGSPDSPPHA